MDYKLQDVEINITSKTAEFGDIKARFTPKMTVQLILEWL